MNEFSIEVKDTGVNDSLKALVGKVGNMQPVLQAIGEDIMERAKLRFVSSIGPVGRRWKPNARATIKAYFGSQRGFGKRGINKKGQGLATSKKPLIGESRSLPTQFDVHSDATSVTVGASMIYAAIQQFGGTKAQFKTYGATSPLAPFNS